MRRRSEITLTYVGSSGRHGSPPLSDELVGVETNLDDVIEQSQQGSQRERRYEDGGEAKLEDCGGERRRLDEIQRTSPSKSWHAVRLQAYCCTSTKSLFYPFPGIHPPVRERSSAADSSLCPTAGAGPCCRHSAPLHLLSSSSCETTSSAAS